jgi:hypothetical protein
MNWHNQFLNKYLPQLVNLDAQALKNLWFFGRIPIPTADNLFVQLSMLTFQFCIWEAKLKKKLPSFRTLEIAFAEIIAQVLGCKKKMRDSANKNNFLLCRLFVFGGPPVPAATDAHIPPPLPAVPLPPLVLRIAPPLLLPPIPPLIPPPHPLPHNGDRRIF